MRGRSGRLMVMALLEAAAVQIHQVNKVVEVALEVLEQQQINLLLAEHQYL